MERRVDESIREAGGRHRGDEPRRLDVEDKSQSGNAIPISATLASRTRSTEATIRIGDHAAEDGADAEAREDAPDDLRLVAEARQDEHR